MKDQRGQVMALALAVMGVGALLVGPFLGGVSVHSIAARTYSDSMLQMAACDAGIEDAIWGLTNGTLADMLSDPGDSVSYSLAVPVNGIVSAVVVTLSGGSSDIASDDFESGGWSGGSGWLAAWTHSGDTDVTSAGSPYEGSYHLQLRGDTGYAKRDVDLSGQAGARLQFWAKAASFEGKEEAYCKISPNGTDWTTVKTWVNGDDDDTYYFYDIDLSSYTLSSRFWIAFEANMSGRGDYLYIDDIELVNLLPGASQELPSDDFESGGWSGGSGWLADWYHAGRADVTSSGGSHAGTYHLRLRGGRSWGSYAYAARAADLSGESGLHLQLWAMVSGIESNDEVYCRVSPNGFSWTTVETWTNADDDSTYHFYDIDISSLAPYSSTFWIAFESAMNQSNDYFYVDDLSIVGQSGGYGYEIVSTAGSETTRASVAISGDAVTISSWQIERTQE